MKVYEALAELFVKEGTRTVFGLMGDGNMYWWTTLEARPDVVLHEARHEGSALTMAEGYARVTGEPGVCAGAVAPGDLTAAQYLDQERFAEATEVGYVTIHSASGVDEAVRQAFFRARVESRPILLNVP